MAGSVGERRSQVFLERGNLKLEELVPGTLIMWGKQQMSLDDEAALTH